jgi:uncharacterized protein (TIGR00369 family)
MSVQASAPPPRPRTAAEQAEIEAGLVEIFERGIPFNQVLGLRIVSVKPGAVRGRVTMKPELVGTASQGRLHGGVTASVLDAMGGLAVLVAAIERHPHDTPAQALQRFARMGTIDLRVDYLRPGIGRSFEAMAEVTRLGGRVGSTQMRLVNDEGTLIATAAAAYIVT